MSKAYEKASARAERASGDAGRMRQLDGLRTLAVATVLWQHWMPESHVQLASIGVQLFYVLSGFLITGILLDARSNLPAQPAKERWHCLLNFHGRRVLRIFPVFYLTLAGACLLGLYGMRDSWGWHAAYLSNVYFFLRGEWHGYGSHFWALAVEQQFYLLWPLLILFATRR